MGERWKELERTAARLLGGERVTVPWTLFQTRPDVRVRDFDLVIDCKAHQKFSHHSLLESIRQKYCEPHHVPCLVTKSARQVGECATVPLDFLAGLLAEIRRLRARGTNDCQDS